MALSSLTSSNKNDDKDYTWTRFNNCRRRFMISYQIDMIIKIMKNNIIQTVVYDRSRVIQNIKNILCNQNGI